jgi:hypothetical protein
MQSMNCAGGFSECGELTIHVVGGFRCHAENLGVAQRKINLNYPSIPEKEISHERVVA